MSDHERIRRVMGVAALTVFASLIAVSLILRACLARWRYFDGSELRHVHVSWLIHQGYVPYLDFFEHHMPIGHYLLSPIFGAVQEGPAGLLAARVPSFLCAVAILILTYQLATLFAPWPAGAGAALLLSYNVTFMTRSVEIQPGVLGALLWLASLLNLVKGLLTGQPLCFPAAGLALGCALLVTSDAAAACPAMALLLILLVLRQRTRIRLRINLMLALSLVLSALPPLLLTAWFFGSHEVLKRSIDLCVIGNLRCRSGSTLFGQLIGSPSGNAALWLLGVAGLVGSMVSLVARRNFALAQWAPAVSLGSLLLWPLLLPTPFPGYVLLLLPLVACYGGRALAWLIEAIAAIAKGPVSAVLIMVIVLIGPHVLPALAFVRQIREGNVHQLQALEQVLAMTSPDDPVLDGSGSTVFRPNASYYYLLDEDTVAMVGKERVARQLLDDLRTRECRVVLHAAWLSNVPLSIRSLIERHYLPTGVGQIWVVGRHLRRLSPRTTFELLASALYKLEVVGGSAGDVAIDGRSGGRYVYLRRGSHGLECDGRVREVRLRYVPVGGS